MKVKELIKQLLEEDQESEIMIEAWADSMIERGPCRKVGIFDEIQVLGKSSVNKAHASTVIRVAAESHL